MNRFVSNENFKDFEAKTNEEINNVAKIRSDLEKYVDHGNFNEFKEKTDISFKETESNINEVKDGHKLITAIVGEIDAKATKACDEVGQNNNMMKEINFSEMQQKMKKYQE